MCVVDNYSTDGTCDIARSYAHKVYSFGPERGAQKNHGVAQSLGIFVLFVDADMTLAREVVAECVRLSEKFDALVIPEISVGEGYWSACVTLERSCYQDDGWSVAARFFRREVFESLGGFDEALVASGDDLDIHQRAKRRGYRIGSVRALITHHEGLVTPEVTFKRWRYYGRHMARYVRKNKWEAFVQYQPIRPAWLRNWRKLLQDPHHTIGFLILKACQLCGVIVGHLDGLSSRGDRISYLPRA